MIKTRTIAIVDDGSPLVEQCRDLLTGAGYSTYVADLRSVIRLSSGPNSVDLAVLPEKIFRETLDGNSFPAIGRSPFSFVLLSAGKDAETVIAATNRGALKICLLPLQDDNFLQAIDDALEHLANREEVVRLSTLMSLYEFSKRFFHATSEQEVCDGLVAVVPQVVGCTRISILLYDEKSKTLRIAASKGMPDDVASAVDLKPGDRIAGKVFVSGKAAILNKTDGERNPFQSLMRHNDISAAISFPLHGKDGILGAINISDIKEGSLFGEADIELLSILTSQAILALENIRNIVRREARKRIVTQLEQYVSPQLSQLLMDDGYEIMNTGKVLDLTVLFADIRHFTELVQELDSQQLRSFLNSYFDDFSSIIFAHEGMIDKYMGDGALVVFGAPIEIAHPEDKAISAARKIMQQFTQLRAEWERKLAVFSNIGLGIGIAKGPVFLGNIGSAQRFDYTVIGMDVNIAQRLASETTSGQILITESVAKSLSKPLDPAATTTLQLRGLHNQVQVYNL